MTKLNLEYELLRVAEMYRISKVDKAKRVYEQFVGLIIADENKERRNELFTLWNKLKGDEE